MEAVLWMLLLLAAATSEDKAVKVRDLATIDLGRDVVKVAGDDVVEEDADEELEATVAARRLDMF